MYLRKILSEPKICIIGAGFAGLRAARHFEQLDLNYLILEGSNRIGGRVYPFEYQNGYLHFGAEYVNGLDNEIYEIVEKHGLLDKFEPRTEDLWLLAEGTITIVDGEKVDGEKLKIFHDFVLHLNETLNHESGILEESQKSVSDKIDEHFLKFLESEIPEKNHNLFKNLIGIYKNYFQAEWSSPIEELSMSNLSLWDDNTGVEDSAVLNEFGFQKILEEFKSKIPKEKIRLNSKVVEIHNLDSHVEISLKSGELLPFDSVIVTCSLGYLKAHHGSLFIPELPRGKQEAIERMGFGNNLKVFLEYEEPWWPEETSSILIVSQGDTKEFMVFQPNSWAENILVCWVAGSGPSQIAKISDLDLQHLLDSHLQKHLKSMKVSKSKIIFRKNWINDEFALGSYSYFTPGQNGIEDIERLGEPILSRDGRPLICFAGEHTDLKMYQTTVGAARSGLREAVRIANAFCE